MEFGSGRDYLFFGFCEWNVNDRSRCGDVDDKIVIVFINEVVVDMEEFKDCLFFFYENFCGDFWMLYLRLI